MKFFCSIINLLLTKLVWSRWLDIRYINLIHFFEFLWTSTSYRSIKMPKKDSANIQPSWPHAWLITHICCNISVSAKLFRVLKITWVSRDCSGYKMDRTGGLSEEMKATKEVQKIVDEVCLELVTMSKRGT